MRIALTLIAAAAVAGCSTSGSSERGEYSVSSGLGSPPPTEERTFSCPRSMSDCRAQAESYCGEAGYRRLRTPTDLQADMNDSSIPRVGRNVMNQDATRGRMTVGDDVNRTMTVQCKPPPREEPEE